MLGYAATHPLRFDADYVRGKRTYGREPGKIERYTFRLETSGSAAVTDLAVVKAEGSPALQLDRAGTLPHLWDRRLRPLAGIDLERDEFDHTVTLELRQGSACPTPVARLDAIWIRYTVLGMEHEQRVPLAGGPAVRCFH